MQNTLRRSPDFLDFLILRVGHDPTYIYIYIGNILEDMDNMHFLNVLRVERIARFARVDLGKIAPFLLGVR